MKLLQSLRRRHLYLATAFAAVLVPLTYAVVHNHEEPVDGTRLWYFCATQRSLAKVLAS